MKTKLLAIAFAVLAPFAATAEVSYSYLDVNYQFGGDMDVGVAIDTDGFGLKGSMAINDNWFAQFDYSALGTDPSGIDVTVWALSAGWHGETFFARAGMESGELDFCSVVAPPCSIDDSGYTVDFGARTMVQDDFELNGHVGYSDLGDLDSFTNYGFGAVLSIGEHAGLSFNYDLRSGDGIDFTSYGLGFRYNFD